MLLAPTPEDEQARLASLLRMNILSTSDEEIFDRISRMAKKVLNVPIVLVSLVDAERQWFKSCIGLPVKETPRDISFCGHAIMHDKLFIIPDATKDDRFSDNPLVTEEPHVIFYAGRPLRNPEGFRVGTLCIIDHQPRELSKEDQDYLNDLGAWVEQTFLTRDLATYDTRWKMLFNHMTVGFAAHEIILNEAGDAIDYRFIEMNPAFERLTGIIAKTAIGKRVLEVLPNTEPYWIRTFGSVAQTGEEIIYENYSKEIGRWFNVRAYRPQLGQFAVMVMDITEQKKLEESKGNLLNLLTQTSTRVPGVIYQYLLRPDGSSCFPYASAAIYDIYRVTPEEVKEDAAAVFNILHPDDYAATALSIQKSASDLTPWIHEYRVKFKDGTVNWLLGNATPEKLGDGSVLWHGFITNINERKIAQDKISESERRLQIILDTCPTAVRITKRGSMQYSYYNSSYLSMTNNTEVTINNFDPSTYYDPTTFAEILNLLDQGENIVDKLVELKKPSDPKFGIKWVLASYFNITFDDQPAILAWFHDITERIRLERMKSEFISTVSHELRTPLTAISGSLGIITNHVFGELSPKVLQLTEVAHRNSLRLTHLINDLLDMDKLVAGKMIFNMAELDALALIERSIEDNANYQPERQVNMLFNKPVDLPNMKLFCDEQRMLQVLTNLLSNAIKFSPDRGEVLISANYSTEAKDEITISVSDQGPGVPIEFHQHLFQKFSQADSSNIRKKGGTGLGLSISRELVKQMGGEIGFTSTEGQGSCFYIKFPLA